MRLFKKNVEVYIANEKTFLKTILVIFRLFTNVLRTVHNSIAPSRVSP